MTWSTGEDLEEYVDTFEFEQEFRRNAEVIIEYLAGEYSERVEKGTLGTTINFRSGDISEEMDISRKEVGRALTSLAKNTEALTKKSKKRYSMNVPDLAYIDRAVEDVDLMLDHNERLEVLEEIAEENYLLTAHEAKEIYEDRTGEEIPKETIYDLYEKIDKVETGSEEGFKLETVPDL